jgi:antitoxin HicB
MTSNAGVSKVIDEQIKKMLQMPYQRRVIPDESGGFTASILEFPGCIAEGDSASEALDNLESAAESWLKVALESGYEVRAPISAGVCSGKIALRLPRSLHQLVAELAEIEGTSLNQLLVMAISQFATTKLIVKDRRSPIRIPTLVQVGDSAPFFQVQQIRKQAVTDISSKVLSVPSIEKSVQTQG